MFSKLTSSEGLHDVVQSLPDNIKLDCNRAVTEASHLLGKPQKKIQVGVG